MKKVHLFLFFLLFAVNAFSQELIPAYPRGGERQAREFISEEMIYPDEAISNLTEGTVIFDFIVQEQGLVKNLKVRESVDLLLEKEATRIFTLLFWQPAEYRGKAVESKVSFEIPFNIKQYRRACRNRGYEKSILPDIPIDSSGIVYLYKYTDTQPTPLFQHKEKDLQQFMDRNFSYPDEALRRNITGVVKINFIVEPHGRISNVRVMEHLGAGCSEEAIRLVKLLRWKPGMRDGKAVRVNLTMPITFGLSADGGYKVAPAAGQTTFQ